jgi:hypothetical protein
MSCLAVNPGSYGAAYGYAGMGPYRGAQAELLRAPFADVNCAKLPGEPHDELEDAFVLLADAFVTGWHATDLAGARSETSGGKSRWQRRCCVRVCRSDRGRVRHLHDGARLRPGGDPPGKRARRGLRVHAPTTTNNQRKKLDIETA